MSFCDFEIWGECLALIHDMREVENQCILGVTVSLYNVSMGLGANLVADFHFRSTRSSDGKVYLPTRAYTYV